MGATSHVSPGHQHQQQQQDTTSSSSTISNSLFLKALQDHQVQAEVTDVDHFRIHGGLAVESDYIITVQPSVAFGYNNKISTKVQQQQEPPLQQHQQPLFESFELSKKYSAFRTLSRQLNKATEDHGFVQSAYEDTAVQREGDIPAECIRVAELCQFIRNLINSQSTRYLGKVTLTYVKVIAKQRTRILNDVLHAMMKSFPTAACMQQHTYCQEVAKIIHSFFLTDHCVEDDEVPAAM